MVKLPMPVVEPRRSWLVVINVEPAPLTVTDAGASGDLAEDGGGIGRDRSAAGNVERADAAADGTEDDARP